ERRRDPARTPRPLKTKNYQTISLRQPYSGAPSPEPDTALNAASACRRFAVLYSGRITSVEAAFACGSPLPSITPKRDLTQPRAFVEAVMHLSNLVEREHLADLDQRPDPEAAFHSSSMRSPRPAKGQRSPKTHPLAAKLDERREAPVFPEGRRLPEGIVQ